MRPDPTPGTTYRGCRGGTRRVVAVDPPHVARQLRELCDWMELAVERVDTMHPDAIAVISMGHVRVGREAGERLGARSLEEVRDEIRRREVARLCRMRSPFANQDFR